MKKILKQFNQTPVSIKEILDLQKEVKSNQNSQNSFYIQLISYPYLMKEFPEHEALINSLKKTKNKIISIQANIKFNSNVEAMDFLKKVNKILNFDDTQKYYTNPVSVGNETVYIKLSFNNRHSKNDYACLVSDGFDTLTEDTLSENIINHITKYNGKLGYNSQIKDFKELYFKSVNSKKFNEFIDSLEKKEKLLIERSPKGIIQKISLNNIDSNKLSDNYKKLIVLKSNGKLKNVTPNHIEYANSKEEDFAKHINQIELYKLHLLNRLKTTFILKEDKWIIEINYFAMKYAKNMMQDVIGNTWTIFKENLNKTMVQKLSLIEDYLNISISNKEDIFPFTYKTNDNGETLFISKEIKFTINS